MTVIFIKENVFAKFGPFWQAKTSLEDDVVSSWGMYPGCYGDSILLLQWMPALPSLVSCGAVDRRDSTAGDVN